jgi:tRNA threonylcarbamoyladenosine biosynthesis protein TsaB
MSDPWLILETSGRGGQVGLALDEVVVNRVALDPTRRHNRDLAPAVQHLLRDAGLTARSLAGVMVSVGPGSFTGLRVGVMSAKALAYALGCPLVAVPTFHAIAAGSSGAATVEVIADALKGLVYSQRFRLVDPTRWEPVTELRIEPVGDWAARLTPGIVVTGPGLDVHERSVPDAVVRVEAAARVPDVEAVYRVGRGLDPLSRDAVFALEPLYLRPSSAEEKAARNAPQPG